MSPDGLRVVAGTECGTLGLLDVPSQSYSTLLRAHTGVVHTVAAMAGGQQFCTGSADGTARVWDAASQQQVLELYSPDEEVLCVACSPGRSEVACGFSTGTVRVFDVGSAGLVQETQQHGSAVRQLEYGQHGRVLFSLGESPQQLAASCLELPPHAVSCLELLPACCCMPQVALTRQLVDARPHFHG